MECYFHDSACPKHSFLTESRFILIEDVENLAFGLVLFPVENLKDEDVLLHDLAGGVFPLTLGAPDREAVGKSGCYSLLQKFAPRTVGDRATPRDFTAKKEPIRDPPLALSPVARCARSTSNDDHQQQPDMSILLRVVVPSTSACGISSSESQKANDAMMGVSSGLPGGRPHGKKECSTAYERRWKEACNH